MENLEFEEQESLTRNSLNVDSLTPVEDEESFIRWIFKFEDIEARSYQATGVLVVVKSNDEVIFQCKIKSKKKFTRGNNNHLRAKVEGFDNNGLRLFEWETGTLGIYCSQDEIRQHSKRISGSYKDLYTISLTLDLRYYSC